MRQPKALKGLAEGALQFALLPIVVPKYKVEKTTLRNRILLAKQLARAAGEAQELDAVLGAGLVRVLGRPRGP